MTGKAATGLRTITLGIAVCIALLYLFFFGTAGSVEVVTLAAVVGLVWWFATVDPMRLVDGNRRPSWRLFGLAGLGLALLLSALVTLGTATMLLTLGLGCVALSVGVFRAVRFSLHPRR